MIDPGEAKVLDGKGTKAGGERRLGGGGCDNAFGHLFEQVAELRTDHARKSPCLLGFFDGTRPNSIIMQLLPRTCTERNDAS